ncbi:hypothetical protein Taro_038829 [Colocasia esculenta]|uniref:Patatin n=1 Tax=Colocasia esculenta TaxID=4460 RepID=A0A843W940_COLES|nr:hypothetical protein [Colocasia esculenta]
MSEPSFDVDKVSYEIFSILESKFLFAGDGAAPALSSKAPFSTGRVRILSVDAGGPTDGLIAAASLARLESSLRNLSGQPSARVADFFDVAAGSGAGGVLVALLFTRGAGGHPLFSAAEALDFLGRNRRALQPTRKKKRPGIPGIFRRERAGGSPGRILRRVFGEATLRDTVKPVLIPCYDMATRAPFLFSRADAVETGGYNFLMREVCTATVGAARMRSVDGNTAIVAVDGGVAAGNPTAAAITHVLNNRVEFPSASGVEDLLVVSLGNGESGAGAAGASWGGKQGRGNCTASPPSTSEIVQIAGEGASDMVDQAVAMSFGRNRTTHYVRIQARVCDSGKFQWSRGGAEVAGAAEELLEQRSIESVLFRGKAVSEKTNAEKLDWVTGELVREQQGRKSCPHPVVVVKQGSPRSSCCSAFSSRSDSPTTVASPR